MCPSCRSSLDQGPTPEAQSVADDEPVRLGPECRPRAKPAAGAKLHRLRRLADHRVETYGRLEADPHLGFDDAKMRFGFRRTTLLDQRVQKRVCARCAQIGAVDAHAEPM